MSDDEGQEPPRPEPEFRVYVVQNRNPDSMIEVTHAVMDVYDIAVGSMDVGSGFLYDEQIATLRLLGEAIGAERFDYQSDKCLRCGHSYGGRPFHYTDGQNRGGCTADGCLCSGFVRSEGTVL